MREIISPGSIRWDTREPYSRIAERLAVDEETVRRRLARLRDEGVIGRFVLFPNPSLLERDGALVYLESKGTGSMADAIPKLKLVDGIVSIVTLHKEGLLLDVYYQGDAALERQIALIESITNANAAMSWQWAYPRFTERMTKTDWAIVHALRKEPRGKLSKLALELGISQRTADRRVKRLNDGHAFILDLEFNIAKISGSPSLLLVHCEDKTRKEEVDATIRSRLQKTYYVDTTAPTYSIFGFHCENVSEVDHTSLWVKKIDGVKDARLGIIESRVYVHDWIDEEIQKRMALPKVTTPVSA